jgi:hypothetical protein
MDMKSNYDTNKKEDAVAGEEHRVGMHSHA